MVILLRSADDHAAFLLRKVAVRARYPLAAALLTGAGTLACNAILNHVPGVYVQEPGDATDSSDAAVRADAPDAQGDAASGAEIDGPCTLDSGTDPDNCGECGHSCLGGQCMDGHCQSVLLASSNGAVSINGLWDIVVDGPTVYLTSWCATAPLLSLSVDSGTITPLTSGNALDTCGTGLAVDNTAIFFGSVVYQGNIGTILSIPREGGAPTPLVKDVVGRPMIVIDESFVYYSFKESGLVSRIGRDGSNPTVVYQSVDYIQGLAIDAQYVYVTVGGGLVLQVRKDDFTTRTLASANDTPHPRAICVDDSNAYWTDDYTDILYRVPLAGGPVVSLTGLSSTPGISMAIDDRNVYFHNSSGDVFLIEKSSLKLRTLAIGQDSVTGIAADTRFVYWGRQTAFATELWRVAR
jgi:hypothetical protein